MGLAAIVSNDQPGHGAERGSREGLETPGSPEEKITQSMNGKLAVKSLDRLKEVRAVPDYDIRASLEGLT